MCHCSDYLKINGTSWGASADHANNLDWLTEARSHWYRSLDWAERGFGANADHRSSIVWMTGP